MTAPAGFAAEASEETLPDIARREVDAELIAGLYRRVNALLVANFGALILLTIALWDRQTGRFWLLAWAVTLGCWTMLRFALARLYLARTRPIEQTWRWTVAFAVGSGVAGILWGLSILFIGAPADDQSTMATAFVMAAPQCRRHCRLQQFLARVRRLHPARVAALWRHAHIS